MSVVGCGMLGLVTEAWAQVFPTVGAYDEPGQVNTVDFIAAGSTLEVAQFTSDVAVAFRNDFGGVNQCNVVSGSGGPYNFSYGISQVKQLRMTGGPNNYIAVMNSYEETQSISEQGVWVSLRPQMTFFLGDLWRGQPDEAVVQFGLTIVSSSDPYMGPSEVFATAQLSGGGTVTASRYISEGPGLGDTFFGFAAPAGQSIVCLTVANSAGRRMGFDDIGFITASVPEPSITALGVSALCLLLGRRVIPCRKHNRIGPH